jgi:hypothetical protein
MDMVAALLLGSPTDGQALRQLLKELGEATVADALPASQSKPGELIQLDKRKPGPRSGQGPTASPDRTPSELRCPNPLESGPIRPDPARPLAGN